MNAVIKVSYTSAYKVYVGFKRLHFAPHMPGWARDQEVHNWTLVILEGMATVLGLVSTQYFESHLGSRDRILSICFSMMLYLQLL